MDRRKFLTNSAIVTGAGILAAQSALATSMPDNSMDKLTDNGGKFVLNPLPFNENFLE